MPQIPDIPAPDPNDPEGMAWIFSAGICDPRPGGYPQKIYPNQQWALKQSWVPTSKMFWDLGLRWHPELQKKWLKGGGQFALAEIVDEKPEEQPFDEMVKEFAEAQFRQMKAEIDDIMANGSEFQKKQLKQRYKMMAQSSADVAQTIEEMLANLPDEENLDKKGRKG